MLGTLPSKSLSTEHFNRTIFFYEEKLSKIFWPSPINVLQTFFNNLTWICTFFWEGYVSAMYCYSFGQLLFLYWDWNDTIWISSVPLSHLLQPQPFSVATKKSPWWNLSISIHHNLFSMRFVLLRPIQLKSASGFRSSWWGGEHTHAHKHNMLTSASFPSETSWKPQKCKLLQVVKGLGKRSPVVQSMLWIALASMQMSCRGMREAKSRAHRLSSKAVALGVKVMTKVIRTLDKQPTRLCSYWQFMLASVQFLQRVNENYPCWLQNHRSHLNNVLTLPYWGLFSLFLSVLNRTKEKLVLLKLNFEIFIT